MPPDRTIMVISHEYPPIAGGGATAIADFALTMAKRGNRIQVVTSAIRSLPPRVPEHENISYTEVHCFRKRLLNASALELLLFQILSIPVLFHQVRKQKPGLLFANFGIPSGVSAALISRILRVPYVCLLGGHDVPGFSNERFPAVVHSQAYKGLLAWVYRKALWVMPNSEGLSQLLDRTIPGLRIKVVRYGITPSGGYADVSDHPGSRPTLLHVARLEERKRQEDLLEACSILRRQGIEFQLRIVGDGALREKLETLTKNLSLQAEVSFTGFVATEDVNTLLKEADVFVLCSTAEGMPRVVLEAIATGLPVVMTNVQGAAELVEEGVNGLLVPPLQPKSLAQALATVLSDPELRLNMAAAARSKAPGLSWDASCETIEQVYDDTVVPSN